MLDLETDLRARGYNIVIGVDEAGRGPLAGPVVAAAVFLKDSSFQTPIRDSKKMTPARREKAFEEIYEKSFVGVGIINETVIDQVNILQASFLAMNNAVGHLLLQILRGQNTVSHKEVFLLIDGNRFKAEYPFGYQTVIQGDDKVLSIACASIVAKVLRDRLIKIYDAIYPQYGFKGHKGYPTKSHKEAIRKHGLSLIHRRTYRYQ